MSNYLLSFLGGCLIGGSALILLLGKGQIAGISGIAGNLVAGIGGAAAWRPLFLVGLCLGPALFLGLAGHWPIVRIESGWSTLVIAGLLVGLGTRLGSGCTSGHGVCGLSRLSKRSFVATGIFLATAMLTVFVTHHGGLQ